MDALTSAGGSVMSSHDDLDQLVDQLVDEAEQLENHRSKRHDHH